MNNSSSLMQLLMNLALFQVNTLPKDASLASTDYAGCLTCRNLVFDFIIVGAGSAGCVLANRLSENPAWKILLIEAGDDENTMTVIPAVANFLPLTKYDWNYKTVHQKYGCQYSGGTCLYGRGKIMGGSSATNGMLYARGNSADYDEWEKMGNPGWSYKDVLPYFKKLENMTEPTLAKSEYHGKDGPISVGFGKFDEPLYADLIRAGKDSGIPEVDYNGRHQIGIAMAQNSLKNSSRCSTSTGYILPVKHRKNLYIFKNTEVIRVLFGEKTPKRAIGVTCMTNGKIYNVYTRGEVILSAGAINTPKLLMLSGVGPREHLREHNIPVIADLPVGKNLQEHPGVPMIFQLDNRFIRRNRVFTRNSFEQYWKNRAGPLVSPTMSVLAFLSEQNTSLPSAELHFGLATVPLIATEMTVVLVVANCLNPASRGTIKLRSNSHLHAPLIDTQVFNNDGDISCVKWGMKQALELFDSQRLKRYRPKWLTSLAPKCASTVEKERLLECYLNSNGFAALHAVGTARMGLKNDRTAVVDNRLKVHSLEGLRVVDASVMPRIPRGNTNAPTIMVAEKAADIIKNDFNFRSH